MDPQTETFKRLLWKIKQSSGLYKNVLAFKPSSAAEAKQFLSHPAFQLPPGVSRLCDTPVSSRGVKQRGRPTTTMQTCHGCHGPIGGGSHTGSATGKNNCTFPHNPVCTGGILEDSTWRGCPEGYILTGFDQTLATQDFQTPATMQQQSQVVQPSPDASLLGLENPHVTPNLTEEQMREHMDRLQRQEMGEGARPRDNQIPHPIQKQIDSHRALNQVQSSNMDQPSSAGLVISDLRADHHSRTLVGSQIADLRQKIPSLSAAPTAQVPTGPGLLDNQQQPVPSPQLGGAYALPPHGVQPLLSADTGPSTTQPPRAATSTPQGFPHVVQAPHTLHVQGTHQITQQQSQHQRIPQGAVQALPIQTGQGYSGQSHPQQQTVPPSQPKVHLPLHPQQVQQNHVAGQYSSGRQFLPQSFQQTHSPRHDQVASFQPLPYPPQPPQQGQIFPPQQHSCCPPNQYQTKRVDRSYRQPVIEGSYNGGSQQGHVSSQPYSANSFGYVQQQPSQGCAPPTNHPAVSTVQYKTEYRCSPTTGRLYTVQVATESPVQPLREWRCHPVTGERYQVLLSPPHPQGLTSHQLPPQANQEPVPFHSYGVPQVQDGHILSHRGCDQAQHHVLLQGSLHQQGGHTPVQVNHGLVSGRPPVVAGQVPATQQQPGHPQYPHQYVLHGDQSHVAPHLLVQGDQNQGLLPPTPHHIAADQCEVPDQPQQDLQKKIRGINKLMEGGVTKMPAKTLDFAKLCPAKWAKKTNSESINLPLYVYGSVTELESSLSGRSSTLSAGDFLAKLRHIKNYLEVCCLNSEPSDFKSYGWTIAKDYAMKVEVGVEQNLRSWESMSGGVQTDHLLLAQMDFPRPVQPPKKREPDTKGGTTAKERCKTYNTCRTEDKCEYEVTHPDRKCILKHECSWCKQNLKQSYRHQEWACKKKQ